MTRIVFAKVMWVGRATVFCVGLAVILAVALGAATTALAAVPGDPFKLGKVNRLDEISILVGSNSGALLRVNNEGSGPSLDLRVEEGEAPVKVDSDTRVANFNADKLDGQSADQLVRVASVTGDSPLADGTTGTVATTRINAPASGFLVIDAGSDFSSFNENAFVDCFIEVDNTFAPGSERRIDLNGVSDVNQQEDCSTNTVVPVSSGNHTVELVSGELVSGADGIQYIDTALSAIYVPFDGTGAQPSSAAISAARKQGASEEKRERDR
jgi:hypothetical protein